MTCVYEQCYCNTVYALLDRIRHRAIKIAITMKVNRRSHAIIAILTYHMERMSNVSFKSVDSIDIGVFVG